MRARGRYWLTVTVSALLVSLCAGRASAQVTAAGQRNLSFGVLVPGVATTVTVDDVARRGEWVLTGRGNTTLSLVLPTELVSTSGSTIPLVFGPLDAAWRRSNGGPTTTVDPQTPFSLTVPNRQTVELYLGGTAQPSTSATAGTYSATITLIVAQP